MSPWTYPVALVAISALVAALERRFPWRAQRQLRPGLGSDLAYLVFNGHFLGLVLYGIATHRVLPPIHARLEAMGLGEALFAEAAATWPLWAQIPAVLLGLDFIQWCVHNALHRVPLLWSFHQTHHSVVDGEMDWIVAFRFQWTEVVVYRSVLYLHHHDYDREGARTVNFGIIFSLWDWLFGTAFLPEHAPKRLGFRGVEAMPKGFLAQVGWPVTGWLGASTAARVGGAALGVLLLGLGFALAQPPG